MGRRVSSGKIGRLDGRWRLDGGRRTPFDRVVEPTEEGATDAHGLHYMFDADRGPGNRWRVV